MMKYIFLLIVLLCSSCSVIKKIRKDKEKESEKTELKTDTQTDTQLTTKDLSKSKIVTNESIDTTVHFAGSTLSGSVSIHDLQTGKTVLKSDGQDITLWIDKSTGDIEVQANEKDKLIPVKFNRRTEKEQDNNITTTSNKKEDSKQVLNQEKKSKTQATDRDIKKTTLVPWWAWVILIVLAVLYIAYRLIKAYVKTVKPPLV